MFNINQLVVSIRSLLIIDDTSIEKLCTNFHLVPSNERWFPGSPSGHSEDYGYYIKPNNPAEWDIGSFDMFISPDGEISWS